jgi:hypothetical protein
MPTHNPKLAIVTGPICINGIISVFVAQSFAPALPLQRKLKKGAKFCGFVLERHPPRSMGFSLLTTGHWSLTTDH